MRTKPFSNLVVTDGTTTVHNPTKLTFGALTSDGKNITVPASTSDGALYASDYATLQLAIDALEASSTAKVLHLDSATTYTITATVTVDALVGKIIEGNGATIAMTGAATIYGLSLTGTWQNAVIRNVNFTSDGGGTHIGVVVGSNVKNTTIEYCNFGAMFQAVSYSGSFRNYISHCNVTGATNCGIYLNGEYAVVSDCNVYSNTAIGIGIFAGNNSVVNCTVQYNAIGIQINGGANSDHGIINGNTINHNTKAGIYIYQNLYGMIISANQIDATDGANLGASPADSSFGIYVYQGTGLQITGNCFLNDKFSIGIEGINKSVIANNTFLPLNTLTDRHAYEVGGTNTNYLFANNIVVDDLANSHTVVLATDMAGATLANNIVV